MPRSRRHREQAAHNARVREYLGGKPEYADWSVTALFYTAVHHVDAFLATIPVPHPQLRQIAGLSSLQDIQNHGQRLAALRWYCRKAWIPYNELLSLSQEARYECRRFTAEQVERFEQEHLTPLLAALEEKRPGVTSLP